MKADLRKPSRFVPSRKILWIDRFMSQFIKIGGIGIIASVLAIFVLILSQVIPLFRGAKVKEVKTVELKLPGGAVAGSILGMDEGGKSPFLLTQEGRLYFVDIPGGGNLQEVVLPFSGEKAFSAFHYDAESQSIAFGTSDGSVAFLKILLDQDSGKKLEATPFYPLGGGSVRALDFSHSGDDQLLAALVEKEGTTQLKTLSLSREENLMGEGEWKISPVQDLSPALLPKAELLRVSASAEAILVSNQEGAVQYFHKDGDNFSLRQTFRPFEDLSNPQIASIDFLLGGVSLYLTHPSGVNRLFSLFIPPGKEQRLFGQTKEFPLLKGGAIFFNKSLRNKAFLVGTGKEVSLRYATTENIRWQESLPFPIQTGILSPKYHQMALLDATAKLHLYELKDPYPEAGWKAFFAKIWYEGASAPEYAWQSTGGSDTFEPKLSLIPLIFGTLKGTIYALIFSIPLALLAALYTSQFLHPDYRKVVKPFLELMASLPSVILGFLAALWLAPLIETRIPSVLLIFFLLPTVALGLGVLWGYLPPALRSRLPHGYESFFLIPFLIATVYLGWEWGPLLERWLFIVTDPTTGQKIADFRLWWPEATGTPFEQRNSLVVGFMMGFAVIPIIYTIAEDSLSQVPPTLRSGALALGASRWQTAFRVVLPTASAGIFSAIMIGLGRAVGETMIVLMATGNTPIMSWNIFSGMRTLSANLAVELPEAPFQGVLYRSLFLGALLLFLMTFVVNTLAEVWRQHLRERYKAL